MGQVNALLGQRNKNPTDTIYIEKIDDCKSICTACLTVCPSDSHSLEEIDWAAIVYRRLRSEPCTAQLTISHAPCECTAIATDDGINTSVHEDIQCIAREIDGKMDVLLQWYLGYFLRTTEEFKSMLNSNHKSCIQLCSGENRVEGYRL